MLVIDALQRAAGRSDPLTLSEERVTLPGTRYIDFLVPGLLGFGLMSSSVWGLGWAIVQMRMGKLLRRLAATPMRRLDFLLAFAGGRLLLALLEVLFFLGFARLIFDVRVAGSTATFVLWALAGALTFGGISALVASRAENSETASGLMNLVTLPMTVVSGVFFLRQSLPRLAAAGAPGASADRAHRRPSGHRHRWGRCERARDPRAGAGRLGRGELQPRASTLSLDVRGGGAGVAGWR